MEAVVVYPAKEQEKAVKTFLKAFDSIEKTEFYQLMFWLELRKDKKILKQETLLLLKNLIAAFDKLSYFTFTTAALPAGIVIVKVR